MAETTLRSDSPTARSRASEALGATGSNWRDAHAQTFSDLIVGSTGRPYSRCGTADIIAQHRAVAALRDLGTAAQPHRQMLHSVQEGSRDPALQDAARRAKFDAEILS